MISPETSLAIYKRYGFNVLIQRLLNLYACLRPILHLRTSEVARSARLWKANAQNSLYKNALVLRIREGRSFYTIPLR